MSNVLSDTKRDQVLTLGRLGWSLRRIQGATGVRRETVSDYLKAAGIEVRPPGRWGHPPKAAIEVSTGSAPAAKPAIEASTGSTPPPAEPTRSPQASACEAYRELIEAALRRGRNAMAIWQDLVDDHGFEARYASVRRYVRKLRADGASDDAHPFIVTAPGEEAQVDYGEGPMVRHPETGKYRRTRLFALTLGYSRKSVRLLTWKSSTRIWCELHEQAFRRLGAAPRVVVLDNLREGVIEPEIYDPELNPLYRDVLAHYGAIALPCRVGDPDRKGKVESAIGHAQKTPLKGLRFELLEEAQAYLDRWEERWADKRIHGTVKQQVAARFEEEKPALLPLPLEPFRYYQFGKRTVHLNGCVEVDGAYYAPPPGNIGRELDVQWDGVHVRILDPKTGELMREHRKRPKGHFAVRDEDRSTRTPPTTLVLLGRAERAGKNIGTLCNRIHARDGERPGVNRIVGVLALTKRHGAAAVDSACALALEHDLASYRFLKRYFERHAAAPTLRQVDPLIRQLSLYRDLIDRRTTEGEER